MGTAIEVHVPVVLAARTWWWWVPVCRCWVEQPNTGGMIYCPAHGWVKKVKNEGN